MIICINIYPIQRFIYLSWGKDYIWNNKVLYFYFSSCEVFFYSWTYSAVSNVYMYHKTFIRMRKIAEIAECQVGNKFQDSMAVKVWEWSFWGSMKNIPLFAGTIVL